MTATFITHKANYNITIHLDFPINCFRFSPHSCVFPSEDGPCCSLSQLILVADCLDHPSGDFFHKHLSS